METITLDSISNKQGPQRIPKIIHHTWKTPTVPDKWQRPYNNCKLLHPDYEFKLWTDEDSLKFLEEQYFWFIDTFKGYSYPIQRVDAIRYFILYHYGGIYMDLDIGCLKSLDPLLNYDAVVPKTQPIGFSNDFMMARKNHEFFHVLIKYDGFM
jgi:inositol phosphorylceramide mannosyltransferase catalytic subunit